jgi:hypothetical protein
MTTSPSNPAAIYETDDYEVIVGSCRLDSPFKGLDGYLIRNKQTGVVEGEVSVEHAAIETAQEVQASRDECYARLAAGQPAASKSEGSLPEVDEFQAALSRLGSKAEETEV